MSTCVHFVWEPSEGRPGGTDVSVHGHDELADALNKMGLPWAVMVIEDLKQTFWCDTDDFVDEHRNAGATEAAKKLLAIARTGDHPGEFGGAEMEEAAQAILALHRRLADAESRLQYSPPTAPDREHVI